VWDGIFRGRPVGPFFIESNLTAQMYEVILQEQIIPVIQEIASQNLNDIYFQQDRVPLHGVNVRQYLDEIFPDRWIKRRCHIECPVRSPDLNLFDYFLEGIFKK